MPSAVEAGHGGCDTAVTNTAGALEPLLLTGVGECVESSVKEPQAFQVPWPHQIPSTVFHLAGQGLTQLVSQRATYYTFGLSSLL